MLIKNKFPYPEENVYLVIVGTDIDYLKKFQTSGEIRFTPRIVVSDSERCIREQITHNIAETEKIYALISLKELKKWFYNYKKQDIIEICDNNMGEIWFVSFNFNDVLLNKVYYAENLKDIISHLNNDLDVIPHCIFTSDDLERIIIDMSDLSRGDNIDIYYIFIKNYYEYEQPNLDVKYVKSHIYNNLDAQKKKEVDEIFNRIMKT